MPGALRPLGAGFRPLISAVLRGLDATIDARAEAQIVTWLDLLATWNAKIDLTAARGPEELVDLMLADALVLARHEPRGAAVVDVGSGAGAPGLALSFVRPDLALTLVEPLAKRVAFLRTVLGNLSTPAHGARAEDPVARGDTAHGPPARVVRGKGETLVGACPPSEGARGAPGRVTTFDTAVARATLAPPAWLALGAELVAESGAVWVLLAREPPPEMDGWATDVDERYAWPLTGAERRALRYRRVRPVAGEGPGVVPLIPPR